MCFEFLRLDIFICSLVSDTHWGLIPLGVPSQSLVLWLLTGHKSSRDCFLLLFTLLFRMHREEQCIHQVPFILLFDIGHFSVDDSPCHCFPLTDFAWPGHVWYQDWPWGLCPWMSGVSRCCSVFELGWPGVARLCRQCMGDCILFFFTSRIIPIFVSSVGDVHFVFTFCGRQLHCLPSEVFSIIPFTKNGV